MSMKIVFMGTPDYAVAALEALIEAGYEVTAAVTQPDKPKGRSGELLPPPVKVCAGAHGIPVLQPRRIKAPEAVVQLKEYEADVYVVAAFGQILSGEILSIPRYGCINIHASLLPKYRGASPIQHAILEGEDKTGITIMQMDEGIDTGDILYKKELSICGTDDYESLHDRLKVLGGEAVTEALSLLKQARLIPEKQREELSCYAPLIKKNMGEIDFSGDAPAIDRKIRAMTPWPSAYTRFRGKQMKIWRAEPVLDGEPAAHTPGEILSTDRDSLTVAAGRGKLCIRELQMEGKKRMSAHDFLLGVKVQPGEVLGR